VGLNPDVLICRSSKELEAGTRAKLGSFCQVPPSHVLTVMDVPNIYHVPLILNAQNAAQIIAERLRLTLPTKPDLGIWRGLADTLDGLQKSVTSPDATTGKGVDVRVALVGKYTGLQDSYLSVIKSLQVRQTPYPPPAC
jgi:CTP synthase